MNPYGRLDKYIAASDAGSMRRRWEYGRRLLNDSSRTTAAGNLRNGVIAGLIEEAHKAGCKLSEREIKYRLMAGKTYPCESQIRHICASYDSWGALRSAGFPAVDAEPGEEPYDPRTAIEKLRATEKQLAFGEPADPGQLALFEYFPDDRFDELSTLAELEKHAEEMSAWTDRRVRKDAERAAYIRSLIAAVNGDRSKTWAEADAALSRAA